MDELKMKDKLFENYVIMPSSEQMTIDTRVDAVENAPMSKPISANNKPVITKIEITDGEVRYEGETCVSVLYLTEEGVFYTAKGLNQFSGKFRDERITSNSEAVIKVSSIDNDVKSVNADYAEVKSVMEVECKIFLKNEIETLPEDEVVIEKKEEMLSQEIVAGGLERIFIEDTFTVDGSVSRVINYNAWSRVKNIESKNEYFIVNGEVYLQCIYEVEKDGEKKARNTFKKFEFSEEIEDKDITENSKVYAISSLEICESDIAIDVKEKESEMTIKFPMLVNYVATEEVMKEITVDAYAEKYEMNLVFNSFKKLASHATASYETALSSSIDAGEENPIKELLGSSAERIVVSRVEKLGTDDVLVEGICYTSIVYEVYDDENTVKSIEAEIPFSEKVPFANISENATLLADVVLSSIDYKLLRGKEVLVTYSVSFFLDATSEEGDALLSKAEMIGEEIVEATKLQIYFGSEGMTSWEAAKMCKVKEDYLAKQNPNLEFPLSAREKIIVFR